MTDDRAQAIGDVLAHLAKVSRGLLAGGPGPLGDVKLTRSQYDALFHLAHAADPVTPTGLATVLGVTPGAVTQLVEGLRDAGLVEQVADPIDARRRILTLSDSAARDIDAFERAATDRVADRFDALDADELRELNRLLAKIGSTT